MWDASVESALEWELVGVLTTPKGTSIPTSITGAKHVRKLNDSDNQAVIIYSQNFGICAVHINQDYKEKKKES